VSPSTRRDSASSFCNELEDFERMPSSDRVQDERLLPFETSETPESLLVVLLLLWLPWLSLLHLCLRSGLGVRAGPCCVTRRSIFGVEVDIGLVVCSRRSAVNLLSDLGVIDERKREAFESLPL
jgi:hypothetical protein